MRRFLSTIALTIVALALLLTGCTSNDDDTPTSLSSEIVSPTSGKENSPVEASQVVEPVDSIEMPPVVGLPEEEAKEVVTSVAPNTRFDIRPRPDVGEQGIVLVQDPAPGETIKDLVILEISAGSPRVPDVVGKSFDEAKQGLEDLGFEVDDIPVYHPDEEDGTVIDQRPAHGTENAAKVSLDVARDNAKYPLYESQRIDEADLNFSTGRFSIDGVPYDNALSFSPTTTFKEQGLFSYNLSRDYRWFNAVFGLLDESSENTAARIEISDENGNVLFPSEHDVGGEVSLGSPLIIKDVDVTGVLRLKFKIYWIDIDPNSASASVLVLGDFYLSNPPS